MPRTQKTDLPRRARLSRSAGRLELGAVAATTSSRAIYSGTVALSELRQCSRLGLKPQSGGTGLPVACAVAAHPDMVSIALMSCALNLPAPVVNSAAKALPGAVETAMP